MLHQTSGRIHNKNVSTHLIGNIRRSEGRLGCKREPRGQASALEGRRCRPFPFSPPGTAPHPMGSDLALPFLHIFFFLSCCPTPTPPQATALRRVALAFLPSAPWMVSSC